MKRQLVTFFIFWTFCVFGQEKNYLTVKQSVSLMGGSIEITVVSENEDLGYINIQEAAGEIGRIEKLISSWNPDSETSLINKNAGIKPVSVSLELFKLIERCKQISEITNGAFDITYSSLNDVWKFDGSMTSMPTKDEINKAMSKVGYRNIILDAGNNSVYLNKKGMKISFGAVGKGYAVDKAKELLVSKQVIAGVINASGDITTWGTKASGEKWLLGIANPNNKKRIFTWLPLLESSVATTGNSEKFIKINGVKYKDILDPRTGYPIKKGIQNVTVFSKSAELCDALATAIMVMGKDEGLSLINQLGGTDVIIVDSSNTLYKSDGLLLDKIP
ncbi:FAD:protein FMN transferase [Maribacter thermophilus]|uniref:FAD:protein FMN transferase n=1 Tax=Maribacter thermophilus TaxID=1197874 RepID=UPI0006994126|nr:FAD:protein FMN transferase [Maribacter thermophilus]